MLSRTLWSETFGEPDRVIFRGGWRFSGPGISRDSLGDWRELGEEGLGYRTLASLGLLDSILVGLGRKWLRQNFDVLGDGARVGEAA
ncbi:hypothetical protein CA85_00870 [Allorhodopirellula solitaria]|uniref:Uncharacterized protein n=1 Tax=Allorhodopirellula solitaria TaxID=2527987 RepID=A0A5C5YIW4_9BACT|nr:hypothetical protein CA85_00870 [Allorhodopirellula solitaria]